MNCSIRVAVGLGAIALALPVAQVVGITINYSPLNYPGATGSVPTVISGTRIAGWWSTASSLGSFLYDTSSNQWTSLPPVQGHLFVPSGISGNIVVGEQNGASNGYQYNLATGQYTPIVDPNIPAGTLTVAGISGADIAGWYFNSSGDHGLLFDGTSWSQFD